jgi:hypothetical protein
MDVTQVKNPDGKSVYDVIVWLPQKVAIHNDIQILVLSKFRKTLVTNDKFFVAG